MESSPARAGGRRGQPPPPVPDSVDRILAAWAEQAPELPVAPVGVVTRLARVRLRLDEELAGLFAQYDLSAADFGVIAALRRAGPPYQLRQSVLMEQLGLTSGTVSVRLTRLVGKQVVTREPLAHDGRGAVITLTEKGLRLFDQVGPAHLKNEDLVLSALTGPEQEQLAGLLRKLLVGFEHERAVSPLGMVLAPAHLARRMRVAVGLSDTPGLLVSEVVPGSVAAAAGVQAGDVLTAVDGEPLHSCVSLAEHTMAGRRVVEFTVLRGSDSLTVTMSFSTGTSSASG
jgi:DNA-binding MarR family transcriptional regulator